MTRDNPLTEGEHAALATAVLLGREGKGFAAKPEDVPACDSLVARGYLEPVEDEHGDVEHGYIITPAFAAALGITAARRADEAQNN